LFQAVFFDLEGVLVNYKNFQEKVVEKALYNAGMKPCFKVRDVYAIRSLQEFHKKQDFFKALVALNKLEIRKVESGKHLLKVRDKLLKVMKMFSQSELSLAEKAVCEYSRLRSNPGKLLNSVKEIPGSSKLFSELRKRGLKTAVITNANEKITGLLVEKFGFKPDLVVTEETGLSEKPDPAMVIYALKKLGVSPEKTILVEDSIAGIIAGKRAGVRTVGVLTGNSKRTELENKADLVLKNAAQVLNIVDQINFFNQFVFK